MGIHCQFKRARGSSWDDSCLNFDPSSFMVFSLTVTEVISHFDVFGKGSFIFYWTNNTIYCQCELLKSWLLVLITLHTLRCLMETKVVLFLSVHSLHVLTVSWTSSIKDKSRQWWVKSERFIKDCRCWVSKWCLFRNCCDGSSEQDWLFFPFNVHFQDFIWT